ncbi:MAG TPA: tetratricopeptide repeat protein [Candidatus Methylacidiphilales bacterium]|nr:tetratricopeptide repeat protein [Candidatus Methylacidiphilales bacterium]
MLFTIGFRLVKLGNPYKRGGGDSYTKRRRYRMLGWGMWASAGVMVLLSLISQLSSNPLNDATVAQSIARPEIGQIRTVTTSTRIVPNLLHAPALEADAAAGGDAAKAPAAGTGSLTLASIEPHQMSITPSLLSSVPEAAPTRRTSDFTETPVPTAVTAPQSISPPPAPLAADNAPIDPTKVKQLDAELAAADALVKKDPANVIGFLQRGNAYGNKRQWDLARQDYEHALQLDPKCTTASFNIAELEFMQGHYDAARPSFLAIVTSDDFGDLAKYKVFLCDLFGGHEQVAAKELAVFNQVGSEASYYFANVAWSLYHKKSEDAQTWWQSATQIFAPDKVNLYAKPLIDLGYIKVTS